MRWILRTVSFLAAGTLLVYAHRDEQLVQYPARRPTGSKLDATTFEVANELLNRWDTLDPSARERIARALLAEPTAAATDPTFRRRLQDLTTELKSPASAQGGTPP